MPKTGPESLEGPRPDGGFVEQKETVAVGGPVDEIGGLQAAR